MGILLTEEEEVILLILYHKYVSGYSHFRHIFSVELQKLRVQGDIGHFEGGMNYLEEERLIAGKRMLDGEWLSSPVTITKFGIRQFRAITIKSLKINTILLANQALQQILGEILQRGRQD